MGSVFNAARTADRLVEWLRTMASQAGTRGAVFGVSGGVDSAAVAGLCVRAFGDRALGLIMPCESNPQDREHAELLADALGLRTGLVDLTGIYREMLDLVPGGENAPRLARANLKARLRMVTLYFHANAGDLLVVGPGNRVELNTGYFTKYGDGGCDVLPLARLVKGQVRELARHLGVPDVIINKPPSAGLWEGQTDEAEMGITYQQLDSFFLGEGVDSQVQDRIESMIRSSAHKRRFPAMPD